MIPKIVKIFFRPILSAKGPPIIAPNAAPSVSPDEQYLAEMQLNQVGPLLP